MALRFVAVIAAAAACTACAVDEDPPEPACEVGSESWPISLGAAQHACVHVELGPHASLRASAMRASAPSLTATHTHYRIRLLEDTRTGGLVRFTAPRADAYVFYLAGDVAVTGLGESGDRRCAAARQELRACAALPIGEVYELAGGETLWLELAPTEDGRAALVLEHHGAT